MPYLLQIDFPTDGPFGPDMAEAYAELARDINTEPGLHWKIWTENPDRAEAGGIYLFDSAEHAERYLDKQRERLHSFGVHNIRGKIFTVNTTLSEMNSGPIHSAGTQSGGQ